MKSLVLLLLGTLTCAVAYTREGNTLQDEFRIYLEDTAKQCSSLKDQLENFKVRSDPLTGYNLKDAVQSLCVCLPKHTEALRATIPAEQLAREVTVEETVALFGPAVIDKCAAEQLRSMYGESCPKRFHRAGVDTARYCPCMNEVLNSYSDVTVGAIAAAASDYLPAAADAEQNGQPAPARPEVLEQYFQADQACKAKKH